ncbi:MAG: DNA adenine methylase [Muribaculaceae bacterium]
MRFIGNKENILDKIYSTLVEYGIVGKTFFDFFSGTTNVARYYKRLGYLVTSSDILYLSYCLQKAYIENNEVPLFSKLLNEIKNKVNSMALFSTPLDFVITYLNHIKGIDGFIFKNYTPGGSENLQIPRMYFNDYNGKKIDAIRNKIEEWNKAGLLYENEYYILLSCLIESVPFYANISGVYAAFQKKWDPRAKKEFILRPIEIILSDKKNKVYNIDSIKLCHDIDVDILYLDPPYNERQYAPNYHLLETIAMNDNPQITGITGMRNYDSQKSKFCNAKSALIELDNIAKTSKYKYLVMSYNSEGIMSQNDILETLKKYGKTIVCQFEYSRFKSNNNGLSKTKKQVYEQLYILYSNEK